MRKTFTTRIGCYTTRGKCFDCGGSTHGYNGPAPHMCDLCSRAKAARLSWGHGDEGDRLIYQHEGVEVLERLQMIEAAILPKHYPLADLDIRL